MATTINMEAETLADYFRYLDELHDSGATNMFGAAPYLVGEFSIPIAQARKVIGMWQRTFEPDVRVIERVTTALAAQ